MSIYTSPPAITPYSMPSATRREIALSKAIEVSIAKGDADGATVIRRAVAFDKFLRGEMDKPENVPVRVGPNAIVESYANGAEYEPTLFQSADIVIVNSRVVKNRNGVEEGTTFIKILR